MTTRKNAKLFGFICATVLELGIVHAQDRHNISGYIKAASDSANIENALVYLTKHPDVKANTNASGFFTLVIPDKYKNDISLAISHVGYNTYPYNLTQMSDTIHLYLKEVVNNEEVVVTALGIKREKKALSYAVSEVKGSELTQAREANVANALEGKVAGVNVSSLATGAGGSSRVVIRGNTSLSGTNQPLYVINGMPMDNTSLGGSATLNGGGYNVDRGDGTGGVSPDDIETITILKGATAAALYGSRASNGAVVITTKSGKGKKGIGLEYNLNATADKAFSLTNWQYEYGQGDGGVKPTTQADAILWGRRSWGAKIDNSTYVAFDGKEHPYSAQKNNVNEFYNIGKNITNSVAFSGGNKDFTYRVGLIDYSNRGIVPNSKFNRKIASVNFAGNLSSKLSISGLAQYNLEKANNRPSAGDATGNPNWGVNMIANTVDIKWLDPGYGSDGVETAWNETAYASNPYFVVNKFQNYDTKNRFIGQLNVKYDVLDNLFLKGSVSKDFTNYDFTSITPTGTMYTNNYAGEYHGLTNVLSETNSMITVNYSPKLGNNFNLNLMGGGNTRVFDNKLTNFDGISFVVPDFYSFSNVATPTTTINDQSLKTNSLFGSLDLDYKGMIFFNAAGREDWFSTLTPSDQSLTYNNHIFYPSLGTSLILNQIFKLPKWVNFAKLRGSWAQVGGGADQPYLNNKTYTMITSSGSPIQQITQTSGSQVLANSALKPYTSTTAEVGLEAKFLHSRLGFDIALYNKQTKNDIVLAQISPTSGYAYTYLNVGKTSNKGIEFTINGTPVSTSNFTWNVSYNVAYNKNKVLELSDGIDNITVGTSVGNWAYIRHVKGKAFGQISGYTMEHDANGNIVYNSSTGLPEKSSTVQDLGTGVAPTTMGLSNTFRYKKWSLDVLVDGKFGNKVFSITDVYATRFGLDKRTLPGRENGLELKGVDQSGNAYSETIPVSGLRTYYDNLKNYTDQFLYDGSFVKMRQVVLSYQLPIDGIKFVKIQSANISFVARNLFILYKRTDNFDPETMYTNSTAQGIEDFALPRTRTYGLNLKVNF